MKTKEAFTEQMKEIIDGLTISTEKMIEFKRSKNSPIVISKDGKIIHVNPHEFQISKNKE